MRRALTILVLAALAASTLLLASCGGKFPLPTQVPAPPPGDNTYKMQAAWWGMDDIRAILLTHGTGTQLFLLFNHGGTGTAQRGEIRSYPRLWNPKSDNPTQPPPQIAITFQTLFNPTALCAGGDGTGNAANRIFVLDQGDTMQARVNPLTGVYGDTTGLSTVLRLTWRMNQVSHLELFWRVREFSLVGGDTLSSFCDTTLAIPNGIAADDQGRVYLCGIAIVGAPDPTDPTKITRAAQWRVYRYVRTDVAGSDLFMPGCRWRRDATWVAKEGSGTGFVQDPRAMFWSGTNGGGVFECDYLPNQNRVQKLDPANPNSGFFSLNGTETDSKLAFDAPSDVSVDESGYVYVADSGNQRVLRYDGTGAFVQTVNTDPAVTLQNPATIAVDDTLVYVGDPDQRKVFRYFLKRRP